MGMSRALIYGFQWKKRSSKVFRKEREGRGKRIRRRGDNSVACEISWDIMIDILTRLPAKSLMRFKCVSNLWLSLIRSQYFCNRYFSVPRPPRLFISWVEDIPSDSLEVCHKPGKSVMALLSSNNNNNNAFDQDLTSMPGMGGHKMVALRGLLLYTVYRKACVYNPATRQCVTLPAVKSGMFAAQQEQEGLKKSVYYFLGHDPVLDEYKVCNGVMYSEDLLESLISEHWVFVLEAGGSWKRIKFDQEPHVAPTRPGLCINGIIYYLATPYPFCDIVVCFDVRSEELSMVQAPHLVSVDFDTGLLGFIGYDGKPALLHYTNLVQNGSIELWVLEDGGKWLRKSLALQACQMHLVNNNDNVFVVVGTTKNGEVIFALNPMGSPSFFLFYNLEKNDLRKVDITGTRDHRFGLSFFYSTLMDKSESILHLET